MLTFRRSIVAKTLAMLAHGRATKRPSGSEVDKTKAPGIELVRAATSMAAAVAAPAPPLPFESRPRFSEKSADK
jgi:hypothetical protein